MTGPQGTSSRTTVAPDGSLVWQLANPPLRLKYVDGDRAGVAHPGVVPKQASYQFLLNVPVTIYEQDDVTFFQNLATKNPGQWVVL